jgi:hypothetical protein
VDFPDPEGAHDDEEFTRFGNEIDTAQRRHFNLPKR